MQNASARRLNLLKTIMKNSIFAIGSKDYQQIAPLLLRLAIGFGFMAHGWAKLVRGPEAFSKLLTQLDVPLPHLMAWISTLTELLAGAALFAGAFVSIVAIPLIATMSVAIFTIHIHYGYSSIKTIGLSGHGPIFAPPGYEINVLYITGLLSLIISGAGKYSLDGQLAKKRPV